MRRTLSSRRTWALPDIRQQRQLPALNPLHGLVMAAQQGRIDPRSRGAGATYTASGRVGLLSRPGGRPSRLRDAAATAHYNRRTPRQLFVVKKFAKYYNLS